VPAKMICLSPGGAMGPASFGGLAGTLYWDGINWTIKVGTPGSSTLYWMSGSGLTQNQFTTLAAALIRVPRP